MFPRLIILLLLSLSACIPLAPSGQSRDVDAGERLLNETFSSPGGWSSYNTPGYSINVVDGVYRMLLSEAGQYIYGTRSGNYDNSIVEVDVTWLSDDSPAFAGVICRLNSASGQGYYVVVSADGSFSVRYITRSIDSAIVRWQSHSRIPRSGSFQMRVVCVDDFIGLYINGNYIDGDTDSRLHRGQIGLTAGLPSRISPGDIIMVDYDNLRIWEGIGR